MHCIRTAGATAGGYKMNQKTRNIVGVGLFTAIVVVLQLLGGGIRFGIFSISLVLVPIVVGAAVYGWKAGGWLGFAFGMTVLLSGDAGAFLAVDPLATVLVVLVKGTACGLISGLVYVALAKYNKFLALLLATILCPVVNTGIFLLGCQIFFLETIRQWASVYGYADAGSYMIFGLAGINFLIELGVNILLGPVITRLIAYSNKK